MAFERSSKIGIADVLIGAGTIAAAYKVIAYILAPPEPAAATAGAGSLNALNAPTAEHFEVHSLEDRIALLRSHVAAGRVAPEIWKLAREVVAAKCGDDFCIPERDYEGEVIALFNLVKKRARYTLDPVGTDTYASAKWTLKAGAGDCDDSCVLLASLLGSVGYPVRFRVIQTVGEPTWNHIYLVVGLPPERPTEWHPLDTTVPQPAGWEVPRNQVIKTRDFEV